MAASTTVFVDQQYNWIILMARESVSHEKCICFMIGQIKLVEECLKEGENKTNLVKRLVSWALQHFNNMPEFKSDVRMLYFWKLLGKYSTELKMGGVMERLNELGFFKSVTKFYLMWAGHLIEENNPKQFNRVVQLCSQNCKLDSFECEELFQCITHAFPYELGASFALGGRIDLGGKAYQVIKLLGTGEFAKIYAGLAESGKVYVLKHEEPHCAWEIYIYGILKRRLSSDALDFVMQIEEAYLFSDSSVIVYDYFSNGSLLDLSNQYKKKNQEIGGLIVAFFAIQLAQLLDQVHKAKIIHADVKPDNLIINISYFELDSPIEHILSQPAIKLTDWGGAIDMQQFSEYHEFFGNAGTKCFDCTEMILNKPWNYQVDFFGFIATIHVLMFKEYMQTVKSEGRIKQMRVIKRRMALRPMWLALFDELLNIPDCRSLPSWSQISGRMLEELEGAIKDDSLDWKNSLERYNNCFKE